MKKLTNIIKGIPTLQIVGESDITITGTPCLSSKEVQNGDIFFAIKGHKVDGHAFINEAISKKAAVIVCDKLPANLIKGVTYICVESTQKITGKIAANFYNNPSSNIDIWGITGTNGKTTTATLLYQTFSYLKKPVALLSTIANSIKSESSKATLTTPNPIHIQYLLKKAVNAGCSHAFMECSSHAIHQHRIQGIQFAGGVFTNLTHEHLDYHKTLKHYRDTKKILFDTLPSNAFAIINIDDKNGMNMLQNTKAKSYTYGMKKKANYQIKVRGSSLLEGMEISINNKNRFLSPLVGDFNALNLGATYAVANCCMIDEKDIALALSQAKGAAGRLEKVQLKESSIMGIIDYAHTPNALENLLITIHKHKAAHQHITTVIGCGGDRDKSKRPRMGAIAAKMSHKVVFTSDNPRCESALTICEQMTQGFNTKINNNVCTIIDRAEAIKYAVSSAGSHDIIVVAGKGHETYQLIRGKQYAFNDKKVLIEALTNSKK